MDTLKYKEIIMNYEEFKKKPIERIFIGRGKCTYMINALHFNDIYCFGDLLELSLKEFKRLSRIGEKTFNVVMEFIHIHGLTLRGGNYD